MIYQLVLISVCEKELQVSLSRIQSPLHVLFFLSWFPAAYHSLNCGYRVSHILSYVSAGILFPEQCFQQLGSDVLFISFSLFLTNIFNFRELFFKNLSLSITKILSAEFQQQSRSMCDVDSQSTPFLIDLEMGIHQFSIVSYSKTFSSKMNSIFSLLVHAKSKLSI